jgi:hypothetical protein
MVDAQETGIAHMVRRSTWIMVAVFVSLVGFAWLFQRNQTENLNNAATATPTVTLPSVYDFHGKQVGLVEILDSTGDKVQFERDSESNQWSITGVPLDQVDSFQVGSILAQLFAITAQETLTQTPPLDSIGLVVPAYTINLTTVDGEIVNTHIGSQTPIGNGYYVRIDSGPIIIVDKQLLDDILELLKNPPLIATTTPEATTPEATTPEIVLPANSGIPITSTP